ncbi:MAG TPA: rod shape-determining protein MreD [Syntrophomonas sp.]|nr:rod shape-determining protein MreD [Syntrophomonas sp.]
MRYILLVLLPFLSVFLQTTIFADISIRGVVPDLVLVFVIFYALLNGANKGVVYGLLCGLLEDLYTGRFIGMNAVSKAATAYIIGKFRRRVFTENLGVGIFCVIIGSMINALINLILAFVYFTVFNISLHLLINVCYQILYNVLLATPLYIWYYRSSKRGWLKETGDKL